MKNADAPALKAVARIWESSLPVNTMTRVEGQIVQSLDWTSRPGISGIHMSITTTLGQCASA
jgi:hypothetical protein